MSNCVVCLNPRYSESFCLSCWYLFNQDTFTYNGYIYRIKEKSMHWTFYDGREMYWRGNDWVIEKGGWRK